MAAALVVAWVYLSDKNGLSFRDYGEEVVLNIKWRWRFGNDRQVRDLFAFCPSCDCQVFGRPASAYQLEDHIQFACEHCGRQIAAFRFNREELESRVLRFIQKRLRDGSWLKVAEDTMKARQSLGRPT